MPIEMKICFTLAIISVILIYIGIGINVVNEKIGTILVILSVSIFLIGIVGALLMLIWTGL